MPDEEDHKNAPLPKEMTELESAFEKLEQELLEVNIYFKCDVILLPPFFLSVRSFSVISTSACNVIFIMM